MQTAAAAPARRGSRLSKKARLALLGYAFCLPWIIGIIAFVAYPTLASFYFSFTKYNILQPPRFVGLQNYINLFTADPRLRVSVGNSLYYTLASVPLGMLSSLSLALLLNARVRAIGVFRTIYYMPSLVPPVAATLLWKVILEPRQGLVNSLLMRLGVSSPPGWFASAQWSKPALLVMSMWGVGAATLIFLASLKEVPAEMVEAATIDGAGFWRRFWSVTIPMISPVILFNLVMAVINSFQVFTSAFVAGASGTVAGGGLSGSAGGPLDSLLMYMVYLYAQAFRYFEMGYASAMAVVLFVVIVSLTVVIFRSSGRWVYYEGGMR
ncbi:MAG: carbohydrate ABC transporter permease [Anaerolineae bacterium]